MSRLDQIEQSHKRVSWGCEVCAEYCDVLPVLDEVKRLRVIEQAARDWAAVEYGDVGEYEAGAALVEALSPLT